MMPPVPPVPKLGLLVRPARIKLPSSNKYAIMPALYSLVQRLTSSPQLLTRYVFVDDVTGNNVYPSYDCSLWNTTPTVGAWPCATTPKNRTATSATIWSKRFFIQTESMVTTATKPKSCMVT